MYPTIYYRLWFFCVKIELKIVENKVSCKKINEVVEKISGCGKNKKDKLENCEKKKWREKKINIEKENREK